MSTQENKALMLTELVMVLTDKLGGDVVVNHADRYRVINGKNLLRLEMLENGNGVRLRIVEETEEEE